MKDAEIQNNPLASAPLAGLIARFAVPSVIGMLVNAAYNITDQIFIGQIVGYLGNAATTVVFPFVQITLAFSQMSGIGTAANFNINLGAGRKEESENFVGTGLTMTAVMAVALFAIVMLFKAPILYLFGATDNVYPFAMQYLSIIVFGLPLQIFTNFSGVLIRADRSPSYSMICLVSGAIINVGLDALFMIVFHWGIYGAAAATVLGQVFSFCLCLRYFFHFKTFRIRSSSLRLRAEYVVQIIRLGFANFINHIVMATINIVLNNTLKYYGQFTVYGSNIPLAVSGIVAKLNSIMIACVVGTAQGCQPIWSFNMGAKNYARVKETYKKAIVVGLTVSFTAFALFQLFPRQITSIFGTGSDLYYQFAEQYLRVYMMMVFTYGIQPITINYFTSIGNMRQGTILSLSRQGFLLLPLLIILPYFMGLNGVLVAGPVADALAAVLSLLFVRASFHRLTKLSQQDQG